jgi:hypothetical protein
VRYPRSALRSSAERLGVEPVVTAGLDDASSRWQALPAPAAADEPAAEDAVVEVAAAAAAAELLVDELLVDELEVDELPQAAAPAARTRQERMVNRRRTLASLARRRAGRAGSIGPLRRAQGRAHLYCPTCLHTTF